MSEIGIVILLIVAFIVAILIMRAVGAWMLRIDEVIDLQKQQGKLLKDIRDELRKPKSVTTDNSPA